MVKLKRFMGRAEGCWRDCGGDFSRPRTSIKGMPVIKARMGD
jgi:hypothetical protein